MIRPADLAGVPRRELLDALTAHEGLLIDARHGIGRQQPPARLLGAALDALACGRALAASALRWEWVTQLEALAHGASVRQVAMACGVEEREMLGGLRARLRAQVEQGAMRREDADRWAALLDRATGGVG